MDLNQGKEATMGIFSVGDRSFVAAPWRYQGRYGHTQQVEIPIVAMASIYPPYGSAQSCVPPEPCQPFMRGQVYEGWKA